MKASRRIALFIDAENAQPGHGAQYLGYCRSHGRTTIARCYGNPQSLKAWHPVLAETRIIPISTPPSAAKPNASDFALVIDVLSFLYRDLFDDAVIASNDADFILLAMHIRKQGKGVYGIGDAKASSELRRAFDEFKIVGEEPQANAEPPESNSINDLLVSQLRQTYDRLAKVSQPVMLSAFGSRLRQDFPQIGIGKGKMKMAPESSGAFTVNADNEVRRKSDRA